MRVAIMLLLCVCLLSGCPKKVALDPWNDLIAGTVKSRTMSEKDVLSVTFVDGGVFSATIDQMRYNELAIEPGLKYVIQTASFSARCYRFVQRTAEDQRPGIPR